MLSRTPTTLITELASSWMPAPPQPPPPPTSPPPRLPPPPAFPPARCTDDPTYTDNGWVCASWADGTPCRTGYPSDWPDTAARIALLVYSCPVTCVDVTPLG